MLDYELKVLEARLNNVELLRDNILKPSVITKIRNYAERYNLPFEFVKLKLLKDPAFAMQFAVDPAKQSIHEKLAAACIDDMEGIENFFNYSTGGADSIVILNGVKHLYNEIKNETSEKVKTVDFFFNVGNFEVYSSHKYTKDSGGSQDNQYHDLINYMQNCVKNNDPLKYFLAIADGAYYQQENYLGSNKIEEMNELYGSSRVIALTIEEIHLFVNHLMNELISYPI